MICVYQQEDLLTASCFIIRYPILVPIKFFQDEDGGLIQILELVLFITIAEHYTSKN